MFKNKKFLFPILILLVSFALPDIANATPTFQKASVRLGRLGISATVNNDVLVTFAPATTTPTVTRIAVCFPAGFTITAGTPTPTTANLPQNPSAITPTPGTLTSSASNTAVAGICANGSIIVSGIGTLTAGTLYGFDIPTGSVTNPATAGSYSPTVASYPTSGTTANDMTTTPTYIYGASPNQDQVTVTAQVAPTFTFSLSSQTDSFQSTLSTSSITDTSGVTMSVSTNSSLGYTAYVASANAALTSSTSGTPISTGTYSTTTPNAISAGSTSYGLVPSNGANASQQTGTVQFTPAFTIADGTHSGSFNTANNFAPFEYRVGYTSGDSIILKERATVGASIGYATNYTDTLTVVAAGNY